MQNIDRFNETAAEILAQLYAEFPRRVSIDFEELLEADDDGGIPGDDEAFVRDTASWLVDSGYIWGKVAVPRLSMATLAPKGLETLKATPSSVDTSSSIGDQLTEAASSGARGAAGRLFSEGLTILFRAGVQGAQAMGGG
ncbi:MAG: hypothetical protein U5K73_08600 [Halofilum sp. (in: g-proteobacteria)]|nr:hypothetical protein [Halofilum sp. (in: g-proteobacteria)]